MIIANPIYDVVFKRLMENERVAKFFISTMLDKKVESVEMKPQEMTYDDELIGIRLFRLDFLAIIIDENGEPQKVLIEIQKAKNEIDLMRFRNYLAEQYKKEDTVDDEKIALPITTIYILGFKLPEIKTACIKVERQYKDLINNKIIEAKSEFVEKLTHDSYVVQVRRITGKYKSRLDKLLSIFEQKNFTDDTEVIKEYNYKTDVEEVKLMTDILYHSGADPATRKRIEAEREAWRTYEAMYGRKLQKLQKQLEEKDKAIGEKDKKIDEKDRVLNEKQKTLEQLQKQIQDLQNKLKNN